MSEPDKEAVAQLRKELQEEYKILFTRFDAANTQANTVKGLATAGFFVAVFGIKSAGGGALFISIAVFAAFTFFGILWVIEAYINLNQFQNHDRIVDIEDYFSGSQSKIKEPFQIANYSWEYINSDNKTDIPIREESKRKQKAARHSADRLLLKFPNYLPYVPLMLLIIAEGFLLIYF